ncbi:GNAT family N-acetyltransferase [Leifsonia flava]|uniref:GNAT family N-acetyltransferase n=2 Tax=Orlajensenia leifsoniae TaxID=2561933 RepID=A0A4Y9R9I7_9MICO|nr:GNAT family N-acetyltransferase [Leifsonia flava]
MFELASRYYGRPATPTEVDQAIRDEPYDDLTGPTGVLLIATEDGNPIACAGARFAGDIAELTKVFTEPESRGRGWGKRLLLQIEDVCRARGVHVVRLDTRSDLVEARALYEGLGFARVEAFNADAYAEVWYSKSL